MKLFGFVAAAWLGIVLPAEANITVKAWGGVGGKGVDLYTLTNANGMQASITNYGAIITAIRLPGADGRLTDVVQGFDSLADYTSSDYKGRYGATIGRFANRIKDDSYESDELRDDKPRRVDRPDAGEGVAEGARDRHRRVGEGSRGGEPVDARDVGAERERRHRLAMRAATPNHRQQPECRHHFSDPLRQPRCGCDARAATPADRT